ncbi:MAG TPA: hypothetical protein DIC18_04335, partial [Clostridiales bacterium]|nr:hypothetical protein [Clostridiales bacterium]
MSTLLDRIAQLEKTLDRMHNELRGKVDVADRKIAESNNLISIMRGKEKLSTGIKSYLDEFFKKIDAFERDLIKSMPGDFPKEYRIEVQEANVMLDEESYLANISDSFNKLQNATKGLENEEDEDDFAKDVKKINEALSELKGYKKLYPDFVRSIVSLENTELSTGVGAEEQKKAAVTAQKTEDRMAAVQAATPLWSEMLETIKQEKAARTKNNLTNTPVLVEEFPDSLDLFLGYKVESSRSINYPLFGWNTVISGGQPYYIDLSKKVADNKLNCLIIRPTAGNSHKDGLKEIIHNLVMEFICQIP